MAPRGETQWVRNLRVAGGSGMLIARPAARAVHCYRSCTDADKREVLRAYLKRWKAEVGVFFDGVDAILVRTPSSIGSLRAIRCSASRRTDRAGAAAMITRLRSGSERYAALGPKPGTTPGRHWTAAGSTSSSWAAASSAPASRSTR